MNLSASRNVWIFSFSFFLFLLFSPFIYIYIYIYIGSEELTIKHIPIRTQRKGKMQPTFVLFLFFVSAYFSCKQLGNICKRFREKKNEKKIILPRINFTHLRKLPDIGLAVRVFANDPEDLGSVPGRVIPKTQKMVLDASLLNTQHYKVRIKGKVEQSREGVAPSPTPWCSSYRKGSLRVTLDYGRQLYLLTYLRK